MCEIQSQNKKSSDAEQQSFQAAHIIVRIPTDQLSHLGDCFTSRKRKDVGAKTRPRALDLCAQSHNQGNSGHASFLSRYHFGPKDPSVCSSFQHTSQRRPQGAGDGFLESGLIFAIRAVSWKRSGLQREEGLEAGIPGSAQVIIVPI